LTVSAVAMMVDYDVRQLSSRVVSALVVALCDMEFKAVKVAEVSGPNRSSTAKGSLYTWSHIHLQDVRPLGGEGCRAGRCMMREAFAKSIGHSTKAGSCKESNYSIDGGE
jgi:hypothetical protein